MTERGRVIVLDDDICILKAVERVLKVHGFDVEIFETVDGFLEGARLRDAICLVLDVDLNGTSGISLARELTRSGLSVPVIFMTGHQGEALRQAALEEGCVAYLRKPFLSTPLIEAIEQIIGRKRHGP